jgi:hypothetical protein
LGAKEGTSEDAPLCRWLIGGVKVDLMTPDAHVLGLSNRWYPLVLETTVQHALSAERSIFLAHPVVFIATKMEAFLGRGKGDLLTSKDVEDFIRSEAARWLGHRDLPVAIEGYLRGEAERTEIVLERLNARRCRGAQHARRGGSARLPRSRFGGFGWLAIRTERRTQQSSQRRTQHRPDPWLLGKTPRGASHFRAP